MAKPATLDGYSDQYTVDCERVLVGVLGRSVHFGAPQCQKSSGFNNLRHC
jgi:hypothetical protein